MSITLHQIDVVTGIMLAVEKIVKKGNPTIKNVQLKPSQFDAMVQAANIIVSAMTKPDVPAEHGSGLDAWLKSDDVGSSSKFLAYVLSGKQECKCNYAHPYDVSDFIRCRKMLAAEPSLLKELNKVAATSDAWSSLCRDWDLICNALDEDRAQDAYEIIRNAREDKKTAHVTSNVNDEKSSVTEAGRVEGESVTPRRPEMTKDMVRQAAAVVVPKLNEASGNDQDGDNNMIETIVECYEEGMDGFELSRVLDSDMGWDCTRSEMESLDEIGYLCEDMLKNQTEKWFAENNIKPPLPIGTKLVQGVINHIYEYEVGVYAVKKYGCTEEGRYLLIKFEDACEQA